MKRQTPNSRRYRMRTRMISVFLYSPHNEINLKVKANSLHATYILVWYMIRRLIYWFHLVAKKHIPCAFPEGTGHWKLVTDSLCGMPSYFLTLIIYFLRSLGVCDYWFGTVLLVDGWCMNVRFGNLKPVYRNIHLFYLTFSLMICILLISFRPLFFLCHSLYSYLLAIFSSELIWKVGICII